MSLTNINGPVRYEKVVLKLNGITRIIHLFSDDHVRSNEMDLQSLVVNTLHHYTTTDIIYEGTDRQTSLIGNYIREFRSAFPNQCWENHTCDSFPNTIFHSVDIRGIINSDWMREVSRIKYSLKMDNIHHIVPQVKSHILSELKKGGSEKQQLLRAWMDSLISISGRIAIRYQELAEDWVLWIRNGSYIDKEVKNILISHSIQPISYDKYILQHVDSVAVLYQDDLNEFLEESYQRIVNNQEDVTKSLSFMVDLACLRIILSLSNPYVIVYMGHQHTWYVLNYLKRLSLKINDSHFLSYSTSFESFQTPNGNPIQCVSIPLQSKQLTMDENIFNNIKREKSSWKYYGKRKSKKK